MLDGHYRRKLGLLTGEHERARARPAPPGRSAARAIAAPALHGARAGSGPGTARRRAHPRASRSAPHLHEIDVGALLAGGAPAHSTPQWMRRAERAFVIPSGRPAWRKLRLESQKSQRGSQQRKESFRESAFGVLRTLADERHHAEPRLVTRSGLGRVWNRR
jgi:hypothetical protein